MIERELASKAIECGAQSLAKDALIAELTLEKMNELSDANDTLAAANEQAGLRIVSLEAKLKRLNETSLKIIELEAENRKLRTLARDNPDPM